VLITVKELRDRVGASSPYSDAALSEVCESVTAIIQGWTGQQIIKGPHTHVLGVEVRQLPSVTWPAGHPLADFGSTVGAVVLPQRPVASVSVVKADGVTLPTNEWYFDSRSGDVFLKEWDRYAVEVTYQAGYHPLPDDIKAVAKSLAVAELASAGNVKRERLDDYEVEYVAANAEPGLAKAQQRILAKYRGTRGSVRLG